MDTESGLGRPILVVDDEPDFCLAMRYLLGLYDFRVVIASNGEEALIRLAEDEVSVIMTDLFMPRMDGIELISRIRAAGYKTPIIAVTADIHMATETASTAAKALGAEAVLIKPFSKRQLLETIAAVTQSAEPNSEGIPLPSMPAPILEPPPADPPAASV
jgi:two-component system alkaline phosphatase synthesis response regulator PhoP